MTDDLQALYRDDDGAIASADRCHPRVGHAQLLEGEHPRANSLYRDVHRPALPIDVDPEASHRRTPKGEVDIAAHFKLDACRIGHKLFGIAAGVFGRQRRKVTYDQISGNTTCRR